MRLTQMQPTKLADLIASITESEAKPVNELGELAVAGRRDARAYVALADEPVGFALIDPREQTVQLAVHPTHRRLGIGTALALAASSDPDAKTWWAFGDSLGAQALARRIGLVKVREIYKMGRPLTDLEPAVTPNGFKIRTFRAKDAPAVVQVNAVAFADHPEQGNLTEEDFSTLTRQHWFQPEGLFVATQDERVVGFHWTKIEGEEGEVYVIATLPEVAGKGVGRALLNRGLAYLRSQGLDTVALYVESSSGRVVKMYRAANFEVIASDASYAKQGR